MKLTELVERYDETLRTDAYADIDASANGLQVGPDGTDEFEVDHVAVAVDAAVATIDEAADAGADVQDTDAAIGISGCQYGGSIPCQRWPGQDRELFSGSKFCS